MSVPLMSVPCRYMRRWLGIASLPSQSVIHLQICGDIAQSPGSFVQFNHPFGGGTPLRRSSLFLPVDGGLS